MAHLPHRLFAWATMLALACPAVAADWPAKPVTVIVGFAAGGNTDMAARIFANAMKQSLPVPVNVENKPGAGGTVGAAQVVRAAGDGTTILVASQSETTMLKANRQKPPYDIDKDLIPVGKIMDQDYVLVVPASSNIKSWSDFQAQAKVRGSMSYATSGVGTTAHVMSEHLAMAGGFKAIHVPYQGASAFRTDLAEGRVDFSIDVVSLSMPFITDGRFRAIAVTRKGRDPRLPDVPSLVELGVFPGPYAGWTGVFVPKGTPEDVRAKILQQINQMLKSAGGDEIRRNGYQPASATQTLDEFTQFVVQDQKHWSSVFTKTGIAPSP
jgi:tripartite-type tricarboxylate transporter receptor subunit TctC